MILNTLFPSIWLAACVLALWWSLENRQKFAQRILWLGGVMFGLGIAGFMLGIFLSDWVSWLVMLGFPLMLLGISVTLGGLLGSIWGLLTKRCARNSPLAVHAAVPPPLPFSVSAPHWKRRSLRIAMRIVLVYALIWVGWSMYWQLKVGFPGWLNFYVHQSQYEALVAKVKAGHATDGSGFTADGHEVNVLVSPAGKFTITIITQSWNHAGTYGYIYDESERVPTNDPQRPYDIEAFMNERINHNWWTYYCGLD
jgi:hypothetical protein